MSAARGVVWRVAASLAHVDRAQWNALNRRGDPFLSYEFLQALEQCGCVGEQFGWLPCHLLGEDAAGRLRAAMPAYAKTNSYGEFVFDHDWAQAAARAGLPYFPKLVSAVPYTPATGARLLGDAPELKAALIDNALTLGEAAGCSGAHWLFVRPQDRAALARAGAALRLGFQYHWRNPGYGDFDDFLAALRSKKRKMIRRERRLVREQGVRVEALGGREVPDAWWPMLHRFYRALFTRKYGLPTFNEAFFRQIARDLGERFVAVVALRQGEPVACALNLRDDEALYGRVWGCRDYHEALHFEACYYAGIDYCIRHGLRRFEPGAQGEHKIPRGFLPAPTWSAHWLAHPGMAAAVARFCEEEARAARRMMAELATLSPYRPDAAPPVEDDAEDAPEDAPKNAHANAPGAACS